jgi:hypothetical protein
MQSYLNYFTEKGKLKEPWVSIRQRLKWQLQGDECVLGIGCGVGDEGLSFVVHVAEDTGTVPPDIEGVPVYMMLSGFTHPG